jgi:hypothetical protein
VRRIRFALAGFLTPGALAVGLYAAAQTNSSDTTAPASAPAPELIPPAPTNAGTATAAPVPPHETTNAVASLPPREAPQPPAPKPPLPPSEPPRPPRSPAAVLQALDKVTAETLRFAAPVGRPIRYKNLVFVVKACETTAGQAEAYLVIDSAPLGADGVAPPPPRRIFAGWMFADSPGLNPHQHPVYDAWLIACMTETPPA